MHFFTFAVKDTTLYEASASMNTGLDSILEIRKDMNPDGSVIKLSRPIIQFDLTDISSSIVNGTIPSTRKFYLNLFDAYPSALSVEQSLKGYPVSQSWSMGHGTFNDNPITTEGASWAYKTGLALADTWVSGSLTSGGAWYSGSGYEASQSFSLETTDLRMDVTDIVEKWLDNTIDNAGFILKRSGSDETSTTQLGTFSFFSRDTNTVYPPKLEVVWDDSTWTTGSLSQLSSDELEDSKVYLKIFRSEYKQIGKTKIRLVGRERFPTRTWATASTDQVVVKTLLSGSTYYSIMDSYTDETIIPFDDYSKVSCDSTGNYFNLWMNGLQPERYYKVVIKVVSGSGTANETAQYFDEGWNFKVTR